ncbi:MAG: RagB/SusD family nutrient uptake outer membrane protein, partial [Ginsengibacter sp.]
MKLNILKYKILFVAGTVILFFATSCKKYVTITTPPNSVSTDNAFADSSTATSIVLGLYSGIASGGSTSSGSNAIVYNLVTKGAMSADVGYYLTNSSFDNFKDNTLAAGNSANQLWGGLYARIARSNYAIEGIASSKLSTGLKNQLLGEAKFMRAWLYFYLVNYFGDVPLVTSTDALSQGLLPRTPVADVYGQIIKDLLDAKNVLTTNYPSTERARINKDVASAFLARVYFYQQNWTEAAAEATAVINSGSYSLVTNLNQVFLNNSNETIWQISLIGTSTPATIMGSEFIPSGTTPKFVLYDTLANTFEANDQRKVNWTQPITYLSKTYYYPYKYKLRTATAGNEYPVMIRLAEMYLIRAEARAQQNDITGAQDDLNAIRNRAGLPNTTASTQDDLLDALEHERWVELFTEFSDRWFNLKRLNKATSILSLIKPSWQPFQQLYPIPQ